MNKRPRPTFAAVAAAALAAVDSVLARWLPDGKREGAEWCARNPTRSDNRTGSFSVNMRTGKWSDFATKDCGGDLVSLVAYLDGCTQGTAADTLAQFLGMREAETDPAPVSGEAKPKPQGPPPACPVPDDAPAPPAAHPRHGQPSTVWVYRDASGRELVRICRFDKPEGKEVLPLSCWRDPAGLRWHWRALPEPRPLYGLDRLADRPGAPVLVCEGEKDADAAAALLPGFVVVTSSNGSRSAGKSDWTPVRGRRVLVWPDADEPGAAYAADVMRLAKAAGASAVAVVKLDELRALRVGELAAVALPDGWGAADALAEGMESAPLASVLDAQQAHAEPRGSARRDKASVRSSGGTPPRSGFVDVKVGDARGLRPGVYWQPVGVDRSSGEAVDGELQFICSPLRVEAKTRDVDGKEWGRLLSWDDPEGRPHRWAMPGVMTARGGDELREHLLCEGLEITTEPNRRRRLVDYIMGVELPVFARCVARTGWHGDVFVLPDCTIGRTAEPVILPTGAGEGTKLASHGTLDDWRRDVAMPCAGNSRLVLALSMGFAAVCLGLSGATEGGGVHLKSGSTAGKSTALFVAASVFGPPTQDGYPRQWKATDNSLESIAALHSDLLLCLDEIGQLEPKHAAGVAYLLANGAGKSRSHRDGSLRAVATWRLLFLSTGEVGLSDLILQAGGQQRAGMEVRVIDLPAETGAGEGMGLFDRVPDGMTPAAFATALREGAARSHGTALPAFLEALTKDTNAHRDYLRSYVPRFAEELAGPGASGQVRRVALRFALIAAGGLLATHAGVTGWESAEPAEAVRRCFSDWLAARPAGRGESEPSAMLAAVRRFIEQDGESRCSAWDRGEDDRAPRTLGRCGWWRRTDAGIEYLFFPESFRLEVCKGFDFREVARVLARHGALRVESDGGMTCSVRFPTKEKGRVYWVLPTIWGAAA